MGGLEVSNKSLRCERCLEIRRITIIPEYPEPKLKMECRCDTKEAKIFEFLNEYKKKENFKLKCAKCQNDNPKDPKYCYICQKIYCSKCCKDFHSQLSNLVTGEENNNDIMKMIGHKVIGIDKVDYHCILHQNEKFIGFCKKCLLNFCQKCEEENLHKDHEVAIFSEIVLDLTKKTIVKGCINLCREKIEHNEKICKKIKKKIKNEENKNKISSLSKDNKKINESIVELIESLFEIYDKGKHINYSIIFNARKNSGFNIKKINFEKKGKEEEDALTLIEYLQNDFVLKTEFSEKKKQEKKENDILENQEKYNNMVSINEVGNIYNDSDEDDEDKKKEKEKEKKNINNIETPEDIKNEIKEEKKEEKKEEEKKEEEKKEEEKKEEEKIEEKKEEEKKEEKKEESKKEKKEREKKEKEEKAKKEKEDKERAKREEKEKKEREKKEKEEKARKEKEDKERAKREEKEKKEKEKKEKEEKARKEKEEKEKAKKDKQNKKVDKKEDTKEDKKEDKKEEKKEEKKEDKIEEKKEDKKEENLKTIKTQPVPKKISDKAALFKQMMEAKGGGIMGKAPTSKNNQGNSEKTVKIEHVRNEGNTVDLLSNIKVTKVAKKKPKKINFE